MKITLKNLIPALAGCLFLAPDASACAVCFTGAQDTLWAYYVTAFLLTCLPFLMVGSALYWLYCRNRAFDETPE